MSAISIFIYEKNLFFVGSETSAVLKKMPRDHVIVKKKIEESLFKIYVNIAQYLLKKCLWVIHL